MLILLLLMFALPANAAYTAAAGLCDTLAGHVQTCSFFGHHSHPHLADHLDSAHAHQTTDKDSTKTPGCDHNHTHAHPLFSVLLPTLPQLHAPMAPLTTAAPATDSFVSALPARLERPPRSALTT